MSEVIWHTVRFGEDNGFSSPKLEDTTSHVLNNRFGCQNAYVDCSDGSATLTYRHQSGAPARVLYDKTGTPIPIEYAISIPSNTWASIEYNGRYSGVDTGNWWYERVVVNVALMESLDDRVFLVNDPIERYTQLAPLW